MRKKVFQYVMILAAMLLLNIEARAEGIFLNDGRVVYGRILSQNDISMQIRTSYGIVKFPKSDIRKIDYDLGLGTVTVVMKNGMLISGTLISITAGKVVVKDEKIDHDIPRTEIENLVLQKFEGRRDNIFGIMGGFTRTTSAIREQTPYALIDLTAFYLRSSASTSFFLWGASASYIKLKTVNSKTNLQHARMTLNPLLIDLRLQYPLLSLFSSSDLAGKMNFFVNCGTGISYVTLNDGSDNRTSTYFTVQPACGISISLNEYVYVVNQYDYLYIHQSKLSYSGFRARLGAGYVF